MPPAWRPVGREHMFTTAPSDAEWHAQFAGQTRITVSAQEALEAVRGAWVRAVKTAISE
jgi:hypothetical protein